VRYDLVEVHIVAGRNIERRAVLKYPAQAVSILSLPLSL
jgi:hypothetical protein